MCALAYKNRSRRNAGGNPLPHQLLDIWRRMLRGKKAGLTGEVAIDEGEAILIPSGCLCLIRPGLERAYSVVLLARLRASRLL